MYLKKFEVRWSDIDANRHVANSAYMNFMSHTRMSYLIEKGFDQKEMGTLNIGPVVFYEHLYYFKEIYGNEPVFVTLELKGLSKDGMFFEFVHNIYSPTGKHHLHCELLGGFIDLQTRKLIGLPDKWRETLFSEIDHTEDFRWLTKEDTRKYAKFPADKPNLFTEYHVHKEDS